MAKATFSDFYQLAKPGIIYGNLFAVIGAYFLASKGSFDLVRFVATVIGSSLAIGCGCVFNNWLDRDIDVLMARTKKRALVSGIISVPVALAYGAALGVIGLGILAIWTNWLTVFVGLLGIFGYVVVYGIAKRRTRHGTLIGSFAGAVPPLAGYVAVSNRIDLGAVLVFLIIAVWQMPHFYGIAMYRLQDYEAAHIPVMPSVRGMQVTKVHILLYIIAFVAAVSALTVAGYTGYVYLAVMLALSAYWFWQGAQSFRTLTDAFWGRKMFRFSLIVLTAFSLLIAFEAVLP